MSNHEESETMYLDEIIKLLTERGLCEERNRILTDAINALSLQINQKMALLFKLKSESNH